MALNAPTKPLRLQRLLGIVINYQGLLEITGDDQEVLLTTACQGSAGSGYGRLKDAVKLENFEFNQSTQKYNIC